MRPGVIVIARGEALEADPAIGLTSELVAQYEPVWQQLQAELAELSTPDDFIRYYCSSNFARTSSRQHVQPDNLGDPIARGRQSLSLCSLSTSGPRPKLTPARPLSIL